MGSKVAPAGRLFVDLDRRKLTCCGPCMISFGVPLLIPGVTLTVLAMSTNTGIETFTGLHITGYLFLAAGIIMVCSGCIVYHVLRVKVGPLPIVLKSQADLRLSHDQRIYFRDKPTFEIAKPKTVCRIENETSHNKQNFRGTGKVAKAQGKFIKHGEQVSSNSGSKHMNLSKLPPIGSQCNTNTSRRRVVSETSEETSGSGSSDSDSEDCTTSSSSTSDVSTTASESSVESKHKTTAHITTNINVEPAYKTSEFRANVRNPSGGNPAKNHLTQSTHSENLLGPDNVAGWEPMTLTRLGKRASEDVKSEELKLSPVTGVRTADSRETQRHNLEQANVQHHSNNTGVNNSSAGLSDDVEDEYGDKTSSYGGSDTNSSQPSLDLPQPAVPRRTTSVNDHTASNVT